jgi:benzoylformate decarboxylase
MDPRPGKVAIFEQFAADGMTHMFGNPGTVEQGLLDVIDERSDFEYVLTLQESVAVGIADGYARATGGPALVQLHTGVGLGNGIGMLYQAKRGHAPLVVIAGTAGVRYDAMDSQMAADLVAMARPVTKYATRVLHPDSVLRVLRRAVKIAMTPPRGPVFVELPMDILDAPNIEPVVPATIPTRSVLPVEAELDAAARLLRAAKRPVILMGDGITVSGAQAELAALAELLGAGVFGVDSSEVNLDTTHPRYLGLTGHMFGEVSAGMIAEADTVLIVGTYVFPEVFPLLDNPFAPGAKIVHVDLDDYEVGKNHPVDVALIADPKPTLAALVERLGGVPAARPDRPVVAGAALRPEDPMIEHFAAELAARAGSELVIFDEALTASPGILKHLPPRVPGNYFATRGGSLGVGIPGAIGAKFARPDAEVIGFTGDGGSMYTIQALWTAARYGVAAKFVICDNGRYRLLDHNIEQYWREREIHAHAFPSSFDLSYPEIGFVELARSLSVPAIRVEKTVDVEPAVRQLLAHDGPFLVDLDTREVPA